MTEDYLERALGQLLQERDELDKVIEALRKRVGKGSQAAPSREESALRRTSEDAPVYRGEFFGLSVTQAAVKLLKRVGIPQKTPQILDALRRAQYEIKSKTQRASVYTSLKRSKDFVKVAPDTWDLSERHPEAAQLKKDQLQQLTASKTRKKRKIESEGLKTVA